MSVFKLIQYYGNVHHLNTSTPPCFALTHLAKSLILTATAAAEAGTRLDFPLSRVQ